MAHCRVMTLSLNSIERVKMHSFIHSFPYINIVLCIRIEAKSAPIYFRARSLTLPTYAYRLESESSIEKKCGRLKAYKPKRVSTTNDSLDQLLPGFFK